jgi:two-component system chemotaxis sensor kinase CheA
MDNLCFEDDETIREFLIESRENLDRLDQEMVELEKKPQDRELLGAIFRTIHTLKGASGFLAFTKLEQVTHQAENLLSLLRDGKLVLTSARVTVILETVDAVREILDSVENDGKEGPVAIDGLVERLRAASSDETPQPIAPVAPAPSIEARPATSVAVPAEPAKAAKPAPEKPAPKPEKQPAPAAAEEEDKARFSAADASIRVGVGLLDKLMDLVGELVLARNQILQFTAEHEDSKLTSTSQRLNLITSELQEGVMKTRMQPIGVVWNNLPRVVRDMAVSLGKQIELKMEGAGTELDRTIIEAIKDPLVHLVRNACDHGLEAPEKRLAAGKPVCGTMTLRAYHEGGQVNIELSDDGAGVNLARVREKAIETGILRPEQVDKLTERETINLIFHPGFSTAREISNISGRGVGMDVVRSRIEAIGGVVDVLSQSGRGTTIKIRIPLTLAIIPGLVISSGGERFIIPQVSLLELIRIETGNSSGKQIEYVHGVPVYRRRGSLLPVAYLNQILGLKPAGPDDVVNMVVLQAEDRQFGLVVDGISDTQEIVVKALGKQLKSLTLFAGATIMGDGKIALILDVMGVGQRSGVLVQSTERVRARDEAGNHSKEERRQTLLLFQAGSFDRLAVPLSLVARLEEFPLSALEQAGGRPVLQYRNSILPLIPLREFLEPGSSPSEPGELLQVIVFNQGSSSIGLIVDQIVDVTEETVTARQVSTRKGILGSAVVGNQVTDFLDLNAVLKAVAVDWSQVSAASGSPVLLIDSEPFSREIVKACLEMDDYNVIEATSYDRAEELLQRHSVALVVIRAGGRTEDAPFVESLLNHLAGKTPVLALADSPSQLHPTGTAASLAGRWVPKYDTQEILKVAAELVARGSDSQFEPELLLETV